ncbi:hypothetical protein DXG01_006338 [Tephrocybe rancida]|nr:hypothetical protein DXG01_006338 [Tephrocybe rancida]
MLQSTLPWAMHKKADFNTDDFRQDSKTSTFKCRLCPRRAGSDAWISSRNLTNHVKTSKHQTELAKKRAQQKATLRSDSLESLRTKSTTTSEPQPCHEPTTYQDDMTCEPSPSLLSQPLPQPHEQQGASINDALDAGSPDPFVGSELSGHEWTDAAGQRVYFSAGEETDPLAESLARALWHAEDGLFGEEGSEDEDDLFAFESDATATDLNKRLFGPSASKEWFPYPDKATFLTDVLFSSPRLRFSRAQQKAVFSWARELGAHPPSYDAFRSSQASLLRELGDPTERQESSRGNVYYLNSIGKSIAKDFGNPHSRAGMILYPEDAGKGRSQLCHGNKMVSHLEEQERQHYLHHPSLSSAAAGLDGDAENHNPFPATPGPASSQMLSRSFSQSRMPFMDSPVGNGGQYLPPPDLSTNFPRTPGPTPSQGQDWTSSQPQPMFTESPPGNGAEPLTSSSSLGRRTREHSDLVEWSPATKRHLRDYASSMISQYGVPTELQPDFLEASTLPTHKLTVVVLAKLMADKHESVDHELQTYCGSAEFREHVVSCLRSVLLDPKVSSYKDGLLSRLLRQRHIRLNPSIYRIPMALRDSTTSALFIRAVSRALPNARSDLKRKVMTLSWNKKTDIYKVVKDLSHSATHEMSDAIWARFAWVFFHPQQLKLSDYREIMGNSDKKDDKFWNWLDKELKALREKYSDLPETERKSRISFAFEQSLIQHKKMCPATKRPRSSPAHQIPAWQVEISSAVEEMEGYSQSDLADDDNEEPVDNADS